jgi:8-oxo-dGTP pyrophosphatase MutT (NUDIX family)
MATPVKAAGGILYKVDKENKDKGPDVLLIYRRDAWDLPKGKKETDESRRDCAVREVSEEVGVDPPNIDGDLGTTYHEYDRNGERYGKTTYWYAMQILNGVSFTPQSEEGIEKVEWTSLYKAKEKVAFDNLKKLLDRFEVWYWDNYEQ